MSQAWEQPRRNCCITDLNIKFKRQRWAERQIANKLCWAGKILKILVIEDEPRAADYLRQGLMESGYAVEVAHNGTDGLHAAINGDQWRSWLGDFGHHAAWH